MVIMLQMFDGFPVWEVRCEDVRGFVEEYPEVLLFNSKGDEIRRLVMK